MRYTGASVAQYIGTWLAGSCGLGWVGVYLAAMGVLTLIALSANETREASIED